MAYTEERKKKVFEKIINCIVDKGMPIREVLKEKWAPSTSTFFLWLEEDEVKSKHS